jgi:hypothetical protein
MSTETPPDAPGSAEPAPPTQEFSQPAARPSRARIIWANVLVGIATVLTILAIVAIWANRQVLDANNWATTSTSLLQNPNVRATAANYIVDEIYATVNVSNKIGSALPPRLKPLATPLAGALRNAAVSGTELALSRPVVQNAWRQINLAADQQLIAIINGNQGAVHYNGGQVTLDMRAIVNQIASRLGISANLGAKLPPAVANLVVLRSKQLSLIQRFGRLFQGATLILNILAPLMFALALFVSPPGHRRRTLMNIGVCGIVAGLIVVLIRAIIVDQVPPALTPDASMQVTVSAVTNLATSLLVQIAEGVIVIGALLLAAGWFDGPSRWATAGRRRLAPHAAAHPGGMYAVVAGILLILFIWQPFPAFGKPVGMLVFVLLAAAGTEILRRQLLREFPDAQLQTSHPDDATLALP